MILSKKLHEIMPDDYKEKIIDYDQQKDLATLFNIEIARYFADNDLKQSISEIKMDYLSFPAGFRWPILSNDTSFALVYLESFDNPQALKNQTLEILVKLYNYSLMRLNSILIELESLEENYKR